MLNKCNSCLLALGNQLILYKKLTDDHMKQHGPTSITREIQSDFINQALGKDAKFCCKNHVMTSMIPTDAPNAPPMVLHG